MTVQATHIQQMLDADRQSVAKLSELLAREQGLIQSRDLQSLGELIDEKAALISHLDQHARIRHDVLREAGLPANARGWDDFLAQVPGAIALRDGWQQLNQDFAACQTQNEINGRLISRSAQTIDHLLGLLRGQTPSPSLYTAKGNRTQQSQLGTITHV